jgi:biopolymer transport protein ExbD
MLIIFMVIVPVMPHGFNSALPAASTKPDAEATSDGPLLIQVEGDDAAVKYSVDGVSIEKAELKLRLAEMLARRSMRQILVKADAGLEFGVVADAINAGKAAGARGIGLVTPGLERKMK